MPQEIRFTRRSVLKTAALAATGLPLLGHPLVRGAPAPAGRPATLRLGVATYSLNEMPADALIVALRELRITNAGLFRTHCPWDGAIDACRAIGEKFRQAGITISGTGVVNLTKDEAAARRAFENAKAAGLQTMVCKPAPEALPLIDRLVKEYDQRLAIHNHGPEDRVYPSPLDAWRAVQPFDARIGLCLDVGHAARAGTDPVAAIPHCPAPLSHFPPP